MRKQKANWNLGKRVRSPLEVHGEYTLHRLVVGIPLSETHVPQKLNCDRLHVDLTKAFNDTTKTSSGVDTLSHSRAWRYEAVLLSTGLLITSLL